MKGATGVAGDTRDSRVAVNVRVRVYPGTDDEVRGTVVEDFGEMVGHAVDIGDRVVARAEMGGRARRRRSGFRRQRPISRGVVLAVAVCPAAGRPSSPLAAALSGKELNHAQGVQAFTVHRPTSAERPSSHQPSRHQPGQRWQPMAVPNAAAWVSTSPCRDWFAGLFFGTARRG